ncbi:NUDIX hydrolase [Paenibacillus flagellatus]|uniref:DNA mismatch repair protein MutT n=1 Tax=Paenibacillus flagellatus TaxID=2211139 RepID=A0A2V5K523_9BACL|nr:NUDIX hydrolase [Paenibacillus flagellatus]PYI54455.1 DNA mismatch repair protein MutT [Paenibacillus flagellatus]
MDKWHGAAGVCVDEAGRLLMVLQGKPDEEKRWSVPSGGMEAGETLEQCCVREVWEETGFRARVVEQVFGKEGTVGSVEFSVTYYEIELVGGTAAIQDPDGLIHDIAWKTAGEIESLSLSFPEDRAFLLDYIRNKSGRGSL